MDELSRIHARARALVIALLTITTVILLFGVRPERKSSVTPVQTPIGGKK